MRKNHSYNMAAATENSDGMHKTMVRHVVFHNFVQHIEGTWVLLDVPRGCIDTWYRENLLSKKRLHGRS